MTLGHTYLYMTAALIATLGKKERQRVQPAHGSYPAILSSPKMQNEYLLLFKNNLSSDQKFSVLMLKDAVHGGLLVMSSPKYSISQAPRSTKGVQDEFLLHIFPAKYER